MPSKRQRKVRAAANKEPVATTQKSADNTNISSPNPKTEGGEKTESELQIDQVKADGVSLTVRPVPGAIRQWISWRYAPPCSPWGDWQAQVVDETGKASQMHVPLQLKDMWRYEFHRGYRDEKGRSHFLGVVEVANEFKQIKERGSTGTGVINLGVKHMEMEQKRRGGSTRGQALEQMRRKGALEDDLGGRVRLPKPRSIGCIDEQVWAGAMEAARGQVKQEYGINETLDAYYVKMCKPGQLLLAGELHRRAQLIYDYRAGKAIYRENRRKK